MAEFFDKLRARRTVLKRTRANNELPAAALYLEWIGGEGKRKILDAEGAEHVLADGIIESNYKIVGKSEAKKLIDEHWKNQVSGPGEPVRKAE